MENRYSGAVIGVLVLGLALPIIGICQGRAESGKGDDLIAHWKFEEGSGNAVNDSSGNGNNGTILPATASEPKWGTGEFAGSVLLSGRNDHHVRIPASPSLNTLKKQITVVAHIYPRTLWTPRSLSTAYISVVQRQWREELHPDLYYLGYGPENNTLHYKWHLGVVGAEVDLYRLPEGVDKPPVGRWVHLAGTYNGETGKMSLYVDGKPIGTITHPGEIRMDQESLKRPLVIGAELNGPNIDDATGEFDGYVDEVRVYDRALSDEEIKTLAEEAQKRVSK
jgi:hypothetical protein